MANPRRTLAAVLLCVCFLGGLSAKQKQREWRTGKVLDTDRIAHYAGTVSSASGSASDAWNTAYGQVSGSSTPVYAVYQTYAIEWGNHVYVCQERLRWRWSKPAVLTVNGPVQFSMEKNRLYLKDEEGREHETKIIKKILKTE